MENRRQRQSPRRIQRETPHGIPCTEDSCINHPQSHQLSEHPAYLTEDAEHSEATYMLLEMKAVEKLESGHENIEKLTSEVVRLRELVDKQHKDLSIKEEKIKRKQKKMQDTQALLQKSENDLFLCYQRYHALQSDSFKRGSPVIRTSIVFQQGSAAASSTSIGLASILRDPSLTRVNTQSSVVEQGIRLPPLVINSTGCATTRSSTTQTSHTPSLCQVQLPPIDSNRLSTEARAAVPQRNRRQSAPAQMYYGEMN